jgi:hypothetical protein
VKNGGSKGGAFPGCSALQQFNGVTVRRPLQDVKRLQAENEALLERLKQSQDEPGQKHPTPGSAQQLLLQVSELQVFPPPPEIHTTVDTTDYRRCS